MITLYCADGIVVRKNQPPKKCTYSVAYTRTTIQELAAGATFKFGRKGYDCANCHRFPLKVKQTA